MFISPSLSTTLVIVVLSYMVKECSGFVSHGLSFATKTLESPTLLTSTLLNHPTEFDVNGNTAEYMPASLLPPEHNRPAVASHRLSRMDVQRAITDLKRFVEARFESDFNLVKHTAPLAFVQHTGVNDELDGSESKSSVKFTVPNKYIPRGLSGDDPSLNDPTSIYELDCEVVQSLAKWKRIMLGRLGCNVGEGIYCDSISIRKGYKGDVTHSVVADQWDFEIRISKEQRTIPQLKEYVRTIWNIITDAEDYILAKYPQILLVGHPTATMRHPKEIIFKTAQELHDEFPDESVHGRENAAVEKYGAIFIQGMGWPMKDGSAAEEVRSPGYDDWNLNGDIMVKHPLTEYRHELSSMGIRVDKDALWKQMEHRGVLDEARYPYQQAVLEETLPFSYGGGIGISRLLMLLLRMGHIGEVQVGVWHDAHFAQAAAAGLDLVPDRILPPMVQEQLDQLNLHP